MATHTLVREFFRSLEARDWEGLAAVLHPDVVYEIPQSRERIVGRDRYVQFNAEYPGDWHLAPVTVVCDDRHAAVRFSWRVGGPELSPDDGIVFFEIAGGLISAVTDFWPEAYEPPPGREHLVERW